MTCLLGHEGPPRVSRSYELVGKTSLYMVAATDGLL